MTEELQVTRDELPEVKRFLEKMRAERAMRRPEPLADRDHLKMTMQNFRKVLSLARNSNVLAAMEFNKVLERFPGLGVEPIPDAG